METRVGARLRGKVPLESINHYELTSLIVILFHQKIEERSRRNLHRTIGQDIRMKEMFYSINIHFLLRNLLNSIVLRVQIRPRLSLLFHHKEKIGIRCYLIPNMQSNLLIMIINHKAMHLWVPLCRWRESVQLTKIKTIEGPLGYKILWRKRE